MAEEVIGLLFGVEGGNNINGASGKLIVNDLTAIINTINSGKSEVPKVKLHFDTTEASKAVKSLKKKLKDIEKIASIRVTYYDGDKRKKSVGAEKDDTDTVEEQKRKYKELSAAIKQWTKDASAAAKLSAEYSGVSRSEADGSLAGSVDGYEEKIDSINRTVSAISKLKFAFATASDVKAGLAEREGELIGHSEEEIKSIASVLGITTEQYKLLFQEMQAGGAKATQATENANRKNTQAWTDYASKVRDEIGRTYDVISKDPNVKELADNIMKYSQSATGSVGDLKNMYDKLRNAIHQSGADVETWGDKFKKTFAGKVRSALAGAITAAFTKYLRGVYQNVVKLDQSLVNLQIASGKTREETRELIKEYASLAKQLGATTTEVAAAADTWLRQGYTTEEATSLIRNSTMLSKLGQMEAAEASKALTSAMKGYKVEVNDSIKIVDKFTAVDMEAAASAGDIATAMAETATSANIAGVSMDKLIGYITTVKEVTQDASESVGTFYKTLFARMNNVAAGKFVDDETGESLNDVETVLGKLEISLRNANGTFRNSGEVLDEVASRWQSFDNVSQHAIATAFAGTKQQEKFIVLMENYGKALEYTQVAAESAGTANEKYSAWLDGVEGKLNALKASFEALSMALLNSELITGVFGFGTWILDILTQIIDKIGGLNTVLYVTLGILATIKADSILSFITGIIPKTIALVTTLWSNVVELAATFVAAKASGLTMGQSISAAFNAIGVSASAAQIAVGAFVAILGIALVAINSFRQAQDEAIRTSISTSQAYLSEAQAAKEDADSLDALIKKYEELAEKNNGVWDDKTAQTVKGIQDEIVDLVGDQALALDLVNGKLKTELGILKDIAEESNKVTLAAAQSALTDSKVAIQAAMNKWEGGDNQYYDIGIGGLKSYGDIKTETITRSVMGAGSVKYDTIKVKFDTAEEFAAQYEAVQEYKNSIAGTIDETNAAELLFYEELNEYLATYKDVYNTYAAARDLVNKLSKPEDETNQVKGLTVALKSAYEILEDVQDGYDGLASALADVTSEGYLTAGSLSKLYQLEKDNSLAGLKLTDILVQDANGYKLAEDALQKYVQALIAAYTVEGNFATQKDKENAIANLKTLQAVLATLAATQEGSTDASKARREELKKEQDAYQDQIDKFEELINLRKDLLQTYKEELDYQKELEKRQRNVTTLQTKLAVARLDGSAAGQARVRELEAELKEAEDELEDFTLEHAIDVLTEQLESTNAEWKSIIQGKLDKITSILESLDTTPEVNITTDTSWFKSALSQIEGLIKDAHNKGVNDGDDGDDVGAPYSTVQEYQNAIFYITGAMLNDNEANGRPERYAVSSQQWQARYQSAMSTQDLATAKAAYEWIRNYYTSITGKTPQYHSGGLVGNVSVLSTSEEFAKLLKGEFVSTPAQMKRFMEETLPKIAHYTTSGATTEFNAPLVEIVCESVTTESMPELKRVVNEAVQEIKRELDSGMSRTGFKRPKTKRLT